MPVRGTGVGNAGVVVRRDPSRDAGAVETTRTSTAKNGTVVDADSASERIDKMAPSPRGITTYEARMSRGGFAGFGEVDVGGAGESAGAIKVSQSPDGRTPSFLAEAGQPLRVVVDPEMIFSSAKKVELTWYLASAGHETKQRITLSEGDRDRRTGAIVIAPGVIDVPENASGTLRLAIETTDANGRVSSSWSPHYDAVVMPKGGATLVFDEDWSVTASGKVRAGEKLAIAYDADRLRSILGGAALESASVCVQFDDEKPAEMPLTLPRGNGDAGARDDVTFMPAMQVPFEAERVKVWFKGTGAGKTGYDSAFGANFTFDVALPRADADMSWKRMALTIRGLPGLTEDNFTGIGPSNGGYNCIAWSIGTRQEWVWPGTTIAAFDELYAKHGYKPLDVVDAKALAPEDGVEKVALYGYPAQGTKPFEATHAARMLEDGQWSSKLGTDPLIKHADPHVVEGPSYGTIARVYVRPRATEGDT